MYGDSPPVPVPANETDWPDVGWVGLKVKLPARAGTGTTVTVWVDLAEPETESVTVRVTE